MAGVPLGQLIAGGAVLALVLVVVIAGIVRLSRQRWPCKQHSWSRGKEGFRCRVCGWLAGQDFTSDM